MGAPHTLLTSPWRGEVGPRSGPGGGESRGEIFTPTRRSLSFASTLPLQGRVSEREARA